ncbi:MAG: hypothetical protein ACUVTZ_10655 [Armatimonadota bacterium]
MPLFTYSARDSSGRQIEETIQADDRRAAVSALRKRGLWATALREAAALQWPSRRLADTLLAAAEESGTLDEVLARAAGNLESEAGAAIDAAVPVLQVLFWAAVAVPMVMQILALAGGYVQTLTDAAGK